MWSSTQKMLTTAINYFDSRLFKKSSSNNIQMDSLDGLRGIAVLFVLFGHLSDNGINLAPFLDFSMTGKYGVILFFVLSSFLLTIPFINKSDINLGSRILWLKYTQRRILRIYPLYAVALLFACGLTAIDRGDLYVANITKLDVLSHLFLMEGRAFFWTIPVETKYYFILPLVIFVFIKIARKNLIVIALITLVAIIGNEIFYRIINNSILMLPYLPAFFIGSMFAVVHVKSLKKENHGDRLKLILECVSIFSFVLILISIPSIWNKLLYFPDNIRFGRYQWLMGFLWAIFTTSHLHGHGIIRQVMSHKILRLIGITSFSLYIWHMLVLNIINEYIIANPPIKVLLIVTISIFISTLSYLYIERPFLSIKLGQRSRNNP